MIDKIKRIVARLEQTPIELRKHLYSNLIKFAEIHPTKIKVGIYAPTGTDGVLGANSEFENFKNEPKILDFVKRDGSTSVTIGALGRT